MKNLLTCLSFLALLLLFTPSWAQLKKPTDDTPKKSTATSYQTTVPEPKVKTMHTLYQANTLNYLPGNRCLEEYTRQLGFRYIVLPPNQNGSKTDLGMRLHNFGTRFLLLLKNGPFWHHRLNKKIKECRTKSGDYVG